MGQFIPPLFTERVCVVRVFNFATPQRSTALIETDENFFHEGNCTEQLEKCTLISAQIKSAWTQLNGSTYR